MKIDELLGDAGERFVMGMPGDHDGWQDPSLVEYEEKYGRSFEAFLLLQNQSGEPPPVVFVGYDRFELAHDGWIQEPPKLLAFPIAEKMPGYQFAVYRKPNPVAKPEGVR